MEQKELLERMKQDPAALRAVMQSQDGQTLLHLLSGSDGGKSLQQAARQAAAGDTAPMVRLLQAVMRSEQGTALVQRLNERLQQ